MTDQSFDRDSWEERWERVVREHADAIATRAPNAHLLTEVADLAPGRALDAGCGHGAEALWLAAAGWQVTAVDFSRTALDIGRATAEAVGAEMAARITWVERDLGSWAPDPAAFDLVCCLYVHVAGSVGELVARLGGGVAPGGTLLLVGHQPVDPATGEPTMAAGQVQVSVADAIEALESPGWQILVAEERPRAVAGSGVDAVIRAVQRPSP
jgi:SAM-dependent methyltransferase